MYTHPKWVEFSVNVYGELSAKNYDREGNEQALKVMLFTGISDNKHQAIFAGDLLRSPYFDKPILVEWDDNEAAFTSPGVVSEWQLCTVIGNIYQNPKLLNNDN
jgi:hypothetical protein